METRGLVSLIKSRNPEYSMAKPGHLRDYRSAKYVLVDQDTKIINLYNGNLPDSLAGHIPVSAGSIGSKDINDILGGVEWVTMDDLTVTLRIDYKNQTITIPTVGELAFEELHALDQVVNGPSYEVVTFDYRKNYETKQRVIIIKESTEDSIAGLDVLDEFKFKRFLRARITSSIKGVH